MCAGATEQFAARKAFAPANETGLAAGGAAAGAARVHAQRAAETRADERREPTVGHGAPQLRTLLGGFLKAYQPEASGKSLPNRNLHLLMVFHRMLQNSNSH